MILVMITDHHVPAGQVATILEERKIDHLYVDLYGGEKLPDGSAFSGAIILGGRMGANDEAEFPFVGDIKTFLREAANSGLPVLGICLGGQIMAEALGGKLKPSTDGEKGIGRVTLTTAGANDPLFKDVGEDFVTFHWHNDSFEIPEGGVLLGTNSRCPAQAFRFAKGIYGLQFHPEMARETAKKWGEDLGDPSIFKVFTEFEELHVESGRKIIGNFLELAER